ncbi:MAG: hypothetical protein DRP65_12230 [Planctomycetota bacterium]|nr:MAG: hypothetical protein DRP65_12230 [Planctomycetota bacterium]
MGHMKIFLDLDGVLVDFVGGIHRAFGKEYSYNSAPIKWNFFEHWSPKVHSCDINRACTVDFWANLDWMCDGREILRKIDEELDVSDDLFLLTCPMHNPQSWTGKRLWVERHIPHLVDRLIVTPAFKGIFASDNAVLIDDKDENIAKFVEAGGRGILVPRPWNELRGWAGRTLEVMRNSLGEL